MARKLNSGQVGLVTPSDRILKSIGKFAKNIKDGHYVWENSKYKIIYLDEEWIIVSVERNNSARIGHIHHGLKEKGVSGEVIGAFTCSKKGCVDCDILFPSNVVTLLNLLSPDGVWW